jgi:hypothetical protein
MALTQGVTDGCADIAFGAYNNHAHDLSPY